jgi:hypothetical protein
MTMSASIPEGLPTELTSGMTWVWDDTAYSDYPPEDGWVLSTRFVGDKDNADLTVTAATEGTGYRSTAAATATAALPPGSYTAYQWVTLAAESYAVLAKRLVTVAPNPAKVAPGSQRTHAQTMLQAVRDAIQALVEGGVAAYSVGTRTYTLNQLADLERLEAKYAAKVQSETTNRFGTHIVATFNAPSWP